MGMSNPIEEGAKWLDGQMEKVFANQKPRGMWWRGGPYFVGDPLPKSLKKQLRKIIAMGVRSDG